MTWFQLLELLSNKPGWLPVYVKHGNDYYNITSMHAQQESVITLSCEPGPLCNSFNVNEFLRIAGFINDKEVIASIWIGPVWLGGFKISHYILYDDAYGQYLELVTQNMNQWRIKTYARRT